MLSVLPTEPAIFMNWTWADIAPYFKDMSKAGWHPKVIYVPHLSLQKWEDLFSLSDTVGRNVINGIHKNWVRLEQDNVAPNGLDKTIADDWDVVIISSSNDGIRPDKRSFIETASHLINSANSSVEELDKALSPTYQEWLTLQLVMQTSGKRLVDSSVWVTGQEVALGGGNRRLHFSYSKATGLLNLTALKQSVVAQALQKNINAVLLRPTIRAKHIKA